MRFTRHLAVACVGMLVVLAAAAAHADQPTLAQRLQAVPYEQIAVVSGHQGETLAQFVADVDPVLVQFSDATKFEACAAIAVSPSGQFGVVVGSSASHFGCLVYHDKVPAGMQWTGYTIHSHPPALKVKLSAGDRALDGITWSPQTVVLTGLVSMPRTRGAITSERKEFSTADYLGGPGFLAAPGEVLFQHGKGTACEVGAVGCVIEK